MSSPEQKHSLLTAFKLKHPSQCKPRVCVSAPVFILSIRDESGEINVTTLCSIVPLCALILQQGSACVRACVCALGRGGSSSESQSLSVRTRSGIRWAFRHRCVNEQIVSDSEAQRQQMCGKERKKKHLTNEGRWVPFGVHGAVHQSHTGPSILRTCLDFSDPLLSVNRNCCLGENVMFSPST